MPGLLLFLVALFSLPVLVAFFWIWWSLPKDKVAPHLSRLELKHLETEDRLRQTNYQILTAFALFATFVLIVGYVSVNSRQWIADHDVRVNQERMSHLTEAIKAMGADNVAAHIAGVFSLDTLALQDPNEYHRIVVGTLNQSVRNLAAVDIIDRAGVTTECSGKDESWTDREEARPEVQAAMTVLGDPKLAEYRLAVYDSKSKACIPKTGRGTNAGAFSLRRVQLEHLFLDDLDLSYTDLSCSLFSQSKFRRTSFHASMLKGADFRGARAGDWEIPGARSYDGPIGNYLYGIGGVEGVDREFEWRRYRCWVADFRDANLEGANFERADLAGADLRGARLVDANLDQTNLSRANLRGANVAEQQLTKACWGDDPPLLDKRFITKMQRCPARKASQVVAALRKGRDIIAALVADAPGNAQWKQWKKELAWFDDQIADLTGQAQELGKN
jgi:hypothetical protein